MPRAHTLGISFVSCLVALLAVGAVGCGSSESSQRISQPSPPDVAGIAVGSQPLQPGESTSLTVTFGSEGSSSADAGSASSGSAPDGKELSYEWSVGDSAWSIEGNGASATLTAPESYGASVTVSVVVRASTQVSVQREVSVETTDNQSPRITSLSADPNPVQPGGTTTLTASASDDNDDELAFDWSAPEGWSLASNSGETVEVTAPDRAEASAGVTLTVSDGFGGTATASVALSTRRNVPPTIASMNADPPQIEPGQTSTVTVEARDPEGEELSYSWSAPDGWSFEGEGSEVTVTAPDQFDVSATIEVTVSDGSNETNSSVRLSTPANDGPVIQTVDATPKTVERGGTIDLSASATDPDGDNLGYNWSAANGDWSLQSNNGENATLTAPDQPGVRTRVSVEVTDTQNNRSKASIVVSTRANRTPTLTALETSPARANPGGTITVRARTSDPDGDSLDYSWQAPNNWSLSTPMKGVAELTAPDTYGASGSISVTISDNFGGQTSGSTTVSTIDNAAPVVSSLSANPGQIAPGATTTLTVSASDPNGDPLSYSWSVPSNWSQSGQGDTIQVQAPDTYGVSGTVSIPVEDGNGGRASGTTAVSTADNAAPVVSSLSASSNPVAPGATTTLTVSASDPNGDPLGYNWSIPGNWSSPDASGDQIQVQAPDQYGASTTIEVVVDDGNGGTTRATTTLSTRPNSAPTITSLTAAPPVVDPGGTSSLEVIASDANGDALTYNWTIPQEWNRKKSGSSPTIDLVAPDAKSRSARVRVEVTDGYGGKASAAVVVRTRLNQPPIVESLKAQPNKKVKPGDTIQVDAQVRDPDGSSSNLTYNWMLPKNWKGSSSDSSIEVTAGRTYKDQTIQLQVDDGTDTTSASVQIDMVDNQKPAISSLTFGSNPVRAGQSTTATVTASDPLGDSLSYNWSLGNNNWTQSGSGKQVQIGSPNQDSATTITVTVSDGFGETVSTSATLRSEQPLYSFSSHTFTTCGRKQGRQGPKLSDCKSAYNPSWLDNTSYYDMPTRGYQKWTVPETATYRIRAAGAKGGAKGGDGAIMAADVQLDRGDTLLIVVGQRGDKLGGSGNYGGADRDRLGQGGGGSFVAMGSSRQKATPLIVAGGGSGEREGRRVDASTSTPGADGQNGGAGGRNGDGGVDGGRDHGAGAGGFYGDGQDVPNRSGSGGHSFRNGAVGGDGRQTTGGFGGGAGSYNDDDIGGGGGYSGGGGGGPDRPGGGGGSFVASGVSNVATSDGNFQDNSSKDNGYSGSVQDLGQWNTGPGSVTITKK